MHIEKNIQSSKQAIKILDEIDGTNLLNEYFEGNKIIKRFPDSIFFVLIDFIMKNIIKLISNVLIVLYLIVI